MLERICPTCTHGNAPEAATCTACGVALEQPLVRTTASTLAQRLPALPARWRPAAQALALGAVALAVEAGAALLRPKSKATSTALARSESPTVRQPKVVRHRVSRTYRNGEVVWETHEETQWFEP